jgi:glycosyltransferase involved in cell wall biosynthesis
VAAGLDADVAALAPGSGSTLDVPVLGTTPLAPATLRALRRRARAVDVVVAYGSSTLPACALGLVGTRTPFVYRSIGDPRAWVRGGLHRRRTAWMMRRAARIVALWPGGRDAIVELYGVGPERIDVIPNARGAAEFRPATPEARASARERFGVAEDATVVAFIGSLTEEKRPYLAVDAVGHLSDATLLLVGDGPLRPSVEQRGAKIAGDRVKMLGALNPLTDVYAAADVVLSTSSTEGMSGVLIEAGLSGVPVCATAVGATPWLFEHELRGAFFAVTSSAAQVAAAIERALATPAAEGLQGCEWRQVTEMWMSALQPFDSLRVLAVLDSTGAGGAETSTALMAPLLREMGVDFQVAFFHDRGGVKQRLIDDGVPIHHVPAGRSRVVTLLRLIRLIRDLRPDVVHTAVYEADIIGRTAGWLCRVPVVSSIISDMYGPEHAAAVGRPLRLKLAWAMDLVTARFVTHFHAISHTAAESVGPRLRIPAEKITVIYRGRPMPTPDQLAANPEIEALMRGDPPDGRFTVLAVGRQEYQKGFDVLIRALAELDDDVHVVIAGRDGNATADLRRLVTDLGLQRRAHFIGERSDVPALMASADLMVVPSRWEGLGGVLVEALLAGARIVISDLPVLREVIGASSTDAVASCFEPENADELAVVICRSRVLSEPRAAEAAHARSVGECFAVDVIAAETAGLYSAVRRMSRGGTQVLAKSE